MERNDVPTIKGKMVKPYPPVVKKEDFVEMPAQLNMAGMVVDLAIDVLYINEIGTLAAELLTVIEIMFQKEMAIKIWIVTLNDECST